MKRVVPIVIAVLVFAACSQDKNTKLEQLIQKRDALNEQIAQLEQEVAENTEEVDIPEKVIPVKVQDVKPSEFNHYIEIQGDIKSDNEITLPNQSSGVVRKIYIEKGDVVKEGQLLAELDGVIYEKNIAAVKTQLELAKTVFERQQRLWDKKIGSEIQYLQAKTNKEAAEQQLQALVEQYKLTKYYAPFSGTVDQIMLKEGEMAAAGFPAIRVIKDGALKITAVLSEVHIGNVKVNDPVMVTVPRIDKEFKTKVAATAEVIDPGNRTFDIEVAVPKGIKEIRPNMVAVLEINDYKNAEAIKLPINAVIADESEQFIFVAVKENNRWVAKRRVVETGRYNDTHVEIMTGLQANEKAIVFGFQDLSDGQLIEIK